eukprot:CAMPEP_0118866344 /NCGR_PEP_ID=MMETSP1163-20130328/10291_1 /TAXON_ID=124430 /ORGANISM="Phaeomonas parva, Strain CCMP2877" /LENGTH=117 /DNA_ID=CAMNT_0006800651 /DNA_START=36 /DNA_END=386 /DNA_ORIENTATION=+
MSAHIRQAFRELHENDGLVVMGRGLGLQRLLCKFLKLYTAAPTASETGEARRPLVFCINAAANAEDGKVYNDVLLSEGVRPDALPKVITYEAPNRRRLYASGGVFIVTSRILVLDFN